MIQPPYWKVNGLYGYWEPDDWQPTSAEAKDSVDILRSAEFANRPMPDGYLTLVNGRSWRYRHLKPSGNPRYLALLDEMRDLHARKSAGYSGQDNLAEVRPCVGAENWGTTALMGCLIRMGDKFRRLQNLTRDATNEQVGESFRDTAIDLASYALIAICLSEEHPS